jgi:tRNA (guanosine-2'-O-)-methyltransferase
MATLTSTELKRLHREWRRRTEGRLALLLDSVQTPYNVGSILRTAAAYRVDHLWLVGATESPHHNKTQKTALGSQRFLTWTVCETVEEAAAQVKGEGYRLVGVELAAGAVPLHQLELPRNVCLAVGHEDRGLSKACLALCDDLAYLPQIGAIGSLNVATAASIALYEVRRQEWTTPTPGPATTATVPVPPPT